MQLIVGEHTDSLILPFYEAADAERIPVPVLAPEQAQMFETYYAPPKKYELRGSRGSVSGGGWHL